MRASRLNLGRLVTKRHVDIVKAICGGDRAGPGEFSSAVLVLLLR
jgi:hypothetical protein